MVYTGTEQLNGRQLVALGLYGLFLFVISGCASPRVSSQEEIALFEAAGPVRPRIDVSTIVKAKLATGIYKVVNGDVLAMKMPAVMRAILPPSAFSASQGIAYGSYHQPHYCRVDESGKITLPVVGEIPVAGKTLDTIERAVAEAFYPKYVLSRPSVVVTVEEHRKVQVAVTGAVLNPGVYGLQSDERSLVAALMKAGGIIKEGATAIRVHRPGGKGNEEPILLPVEGLYIPFSDVEVRGGETIEVERIDPNVFSIVGLVNKAGAFEYPPGARFTLAQALGFAEGRDRVADPQYAQILRQAPDGRIVEATFDITDSGLRKSAGVMIKPGDIVIVVDTPRTQFRSIGASLFYRTIHIGATYDLGNIWGEDD